MALSLAIIREDDDKSDGTREERRPGARFGRRH